MSPRALRALAFAAILLASAGFVSLLNPPTVRDWTTLDNAGPSSPIDLKAGQLYSLKVDGGCSNTLKFPVYAEVLDASNGTLVWSSQQTMMSGARSCRLTASMGEFRVPHDGRYLINWSIGTDLAARGPRFTLTAPPLPSAASWTMCYGGLFAGLVLFGASVVKRQEALATRKRELDAIQANAEKPMLVARVVEDSAGAPPQPHDNPDSPASAEPQGRGGPSGPREEI